MIWLHKSTENHQTYWPSFPQNIQWPTRGRVNSNLEGWVITDSPWAPIAASWDGWSVYNACFCHVLFACGGYHNWNRNGAFMPPINSSICWCLDKQRCVLALAQTPRDGISRIIIWGVLCQKQASKAGASNYIPQYLWVLLFVPALDTCIYG